MAVLLAPQDNANMAQAQWGEMVSGLFGTAVLQNQLNAFAVTTTSGLGISVASGKAMIQGFYARSDAAVALTCAAADPTNPRIDRAVLHADLTAHTLTVILLTGTPAPSPSPPVLTQTATVWEISMCQVRVNANQVTLTGGSLTDERAYCVPNIPIGAIVDNMLANLKLSKAGDAMTGALTGVGGQATAGSFGVPTIVAQALAVAISGTTQQTVLSYTPAGSGTFRANLNIFYQNTVNQIPTAFLSYSDPDSLGVPTIPFVTPARVAGGGAPDAPVMMDGSGVAYSHGLSLPTFPIVFRASAAGAITIKYQDPGGVPADIVTAILERLA